VEASSGRGDIVLDVPGLVKYAIDARTRLGVVSSDVAVKGSPAAPASVAAAAPRLTLRMGFGGITIKDLPAEAVVPAFTAQP
jgi:hypothetical protein